LIGFLPQLNQLAVRHAPDVDRAKLERLASCRMSPHKTTGAGSTVDQSSHDRISFGSDQVLDGRAEIRALEQVYEAQKINYSILGNIVPHLHAHIQPRFMATRTRVDR
jgi:hypothetical protein